MFDGLRRVLGIAPARDVQTGVSDEPVLEAAYVAPAVQLYIAESSLSDGEFVEAVENGSFERDGDVFIAWRKDTTGELYYRRAGVAGSDPDSPAQTLESFDQPPPVYGVSEIIEDVEGDA